ncbi:MAG: alkaline phosphatase D family protein [Verrucomicrobiota bacterium]
MKFTLVALVWVLILSACGKKEPITRIAFGSCAKQTLEQPIWVAVGKFNPDVWIWMGDNIYGDTEDMEVMAKKYAIQKNKPGYAKLRELAEVIGTWDDHDYGINNGGKEFSAKAGSQKALLDF